MRQRSLKDNKISSPYYKDLKQRIEKIFAPLLDEYGLEINALGGQGVTRKAPLGNRFFRVFVRFYKTRCGFQSVTYDALGLAC